MNDDSQGVWKIPAELKSNSGGENVPHFYTIMETDEYDEEFQRLMGVQDHNL